MNDFGKELEVQHLAAEIFKRHVNWMTPDAAFGAAQAFIKLRDARMETAREQLKQRASGGGSASGSGL